ncbi:hypothetical protein TWF106_003600 [Orbilia oligospora]|uniref:Uncharacterized protein n=1 Tax=Orbilia oligospora TaxID=2813651 RepID=A0A7C8QX39_ORBOL|nr:hypothetical protein TWF106_003600 [Orbilia oligospora]
MENYTQQMKIFNSSCQSEGKAKEKRGKMIPLACGNYRRLAAPRAESDLSQTRVILLAQNVTLHPLRSLCAGRVKWMAHSPIRLRPGTPQKRLSGIKNQLRLVGQNQLIFWRPQGQREQAR